MKEFSVEVQKQKLYNNDPYPGQFQHQPSAIEQDPIAGVGGRFGKSGKSGISRGI